MKDGGKLSYQLKKFHYLEFLVNGAGEDWGQEEKGTTEDEMTGWHHRLNGHGFGWTLAAGDGQGGLACCNSWGRKELVTTERLNWTELKLIYGTVCGLEFINVHEIM